MPELCAYVTERAVEGPCENDGCGQEPDGTYWDGIPTHEFSHVYLGPVLAHCGLERGSIIHMSPVGIEHAVTGMHAFAAEPVHA